MHGDDVGLDCWHFEQTAAALAWVSFRREKPEAGLEWIDRCTQSSPTQRDLARLDWQEISPGTSTATRIEEEDPVYNLSDDPEAHRSIAHVAGAGGNVEAWREFLGTWFVDIFFCVANGSHSCSKCSVKVYCLPAGGNGSDLSLQNSGTDLIMCATRRVLLAPLPFFTRQHLAADIVSMKWIVWCLAFLPHYARRFSRLSRVCRTLGF